MLSMAKLEPPAFTNKQNVSYFAEHILPIWKCVLLNTIEIYFNLEQSNAFVHFWERNSAFELNPLKVHARSDKNKGEQCLNWKKKYSRLGSQLKNSFWYISVLW